MKIYCNIRKNNNKKKKILKEEVKEEEDKSIDIFLVLYGIVGAVVGVRYC